jgi:hypothetical protein
MDAQTLKEMLSGGAKLDLVEEESIQSFRFTHDGHAIATFGPRPDGPITGFGTPFSVTEEGNLEFGRRGTDFHLAWDVLGLESDILSVSYKGHLLRFRFTPGRPKPKPYLP